MADGCEISGLRGNLRQIEPHFIFSLSLRNSLPQDPQIIFIVKLQVNKNDRNNEESFVSVCWCAVVALISYFRDVKGEIK